MPVPEVEVIKNGTNVRKGGAVSGPDNIIGHVDRGLYAAYGQCAGEKVFENDGTVHNQWWVLIGIGWAPYRGWVSAARIRGGHNDGPIPGVTVEETAFVDPTGP